MEQQVMQDLKHENIIVLKRILFSNFHVFIEMEKIEGGTLEKFITKSLKPGESPLDEDQSSTT
jgi:serine/threonine protein kinase